MQITCIEVQEMVQEMNALAFHPEEKPRSASADYHCPAASLLTGLQVDTLCLYDTLCNTESLWMINSWH